ncbi:MAG: IPT/TIG domain-containing protein, partial [Chthoniobacteraceae bacterium]
MHHTLRSFARCVAFALLTLATVLPARATVPSDWSPAGSLASGRLNHTATLLPSGKVLVAGGGALAGPFGSTPVANAELYTPPAPAGPPVTGINPARGSISGGTNVTITGSQFTGATAVTIGGVAATNVTVLSDTSIRCFTGATT